MPTPESERMLAALRDRAGRAASAEQVATASVEMLREISGTLVPILGDRGVAALRARGLFLAARRHPWLGAPEIAPDYLLSVDGLFAALITQSPTESLAGSGAFFQEFHDLLASMVGMGLTARLLRSAADTLEGGPTAEATP